MTKKTHERSAANARDVAAALRKRNSRWDKFQIHKLLFFIQCTHLAWQNRPAFSEKIEAWEKGPVVASLWREERPLRQRFRPSAQPMPVPATVENVISNVIARYGHLSGPEFIELTHNEGPWADITKDSGPANQIIDHAQMQEYASNISPGLRTLRDRIQQNQDRQPFKADAPGDLERLIATRQPR